MLPLCLAGDIYHFTAFIPDKDIKYKFKGLTDQVKSIK